MIMILHICRPRWFQRTWFGVNQPSGCWVSASTRFQEPLSCPWPCPLCPYGQMTMMLHIYRPKKVVLKGCMCLLCTSLVWTSGNPSKLLMHAKLITISCIIHRLEFEEVKALKEITFHKVICSVAIHITNIYWWEVHTYQTTSSGTKYVPGLQQIPCILD